MYYAPMLEELKNDGKDFEADSWSLAVDSSYLQSHRKDVIKRQDVIYGETCTRQYVLPQFLRTLSSCNSRQTVRLLVHALVQPMAKEMFGNVNWYFHLTHYSNRLFSPVFGVKIVACLWLLDSTVYCMSNETVPVTIERQVRQRIHVQ